MPTSYKLGSESQDGISDTIGIYISGLKQA